MKKRSLLLSTSKFLFAIMIFILAACNSNTSTSQIKVENKIIFENEDPELIVTFSLTVTNLSDTLSVPVLSNDNVFQYAEYYINNKKITNPVALGGIETKRENDFILKGESDEFTWGTTADYLKKEYGNIFIVKLKYLTTYSNILEVNLEDKKIVEINEEK